MSTNTLNYVNLNDINISLFKKHSWINQHLMMSKLNANYYQGLIELEEMDKGGFEHGDLSGLYIKYQDDLRYHSTRFHGWQRLLNIMMENIALKTPTNNSVVIDFLAGSGTLGKRLKQLFKPNYLPKLMGLDVSSKMCEQALKSNEIVMWGSYKYHLFHHEIADAVIAAYGFHHVPLSERKMYVNKMHDLLRNEGVCILHDFEEGSQTAKWYSEIIHRYRPNGHDYPHITYESLTTLLCNFKDVNIKKIYDPFYLEGVKGQNEQSLKQEFLSYLICLFNLQKLVPNYINIAELKNFDDRQFWLNIENILLPYFYLSEKELNSIELNEVNPTTAIKIINIPICERFTIQPLSDNRLSIIAPRTALIGIGYRGNTHE